MKIISTLTAPVRIAMAVGLTILVVGIISGFGNLWSRPFTTLFWRFAWDVRDMFTRWNAPTLGWLAGIFILICIWYAVYGLFAGVVMKFRGRTHDLKKGRD